MKYFQIFHNHQISLSDIDLHSPAFARLQEQAIFPASTYTWKRSGLTQEQSASRSGVALTVLREIEQGKADLQLEKVNQVLAMFGHELAPVSSKDLLNNKTNGIDL